MKREIGLISLVAVAAWFGLHTLSSSRALLSPADFTAGGPDAVEFCDPRNPRFMTVIDRRSAVILTGEAPDRIHLATAAGRPIGPKDLEGGSLRIFAVDDEIRSFASGAAAPGSTPGDWKFGFSHASRLFADFTPRAIGQELYAAATVGGAARSAAATAQDLSITLSTLPRRIFARQPAEILVQASDPIGQAELSVFDVHAGGPTGFVVRSPERVDERVMRFALNFPDAGEYVLWVQTGVGPGAKFRRFETEVSP